MSISTQRKFLTRLDAIAQSRDLQVRVDTTWANIGRAYIEAPDAFSPILTIAFRFDSQYVTLHSQPVKLQKSADQPQNDHGLHKPDNGELDAFLERVSDYLDSV